MRIYRFISAAIGSVLLAGVSTAAFAGCGIAPAPNCNPGVVSYPGAVNPLAPVGMYSTAPYGYLKSFAYKNTPNVNIMRLHSRAPLVNLNDAPSQFTGGCNPSSTVYCRKPQRPAVVMPRQYIAPVASAPTIVYAPRPAPVRTIVRTAPVVSTRTIVRTAPVVSRLPAPQISASGGYWEKTAGPSIVDGLPATQILCRRQAPRPASMPAPVSVRVVRPVIGVPQPVPTPVRVPVYRPAAPACGPVLAGGPKNSISRYGSRWTY